MTVEPVMKKGGKRMSKSLRRSLSLALAVVMLFSLSMTAFAVDDAQLVPEYDLSESEAAVVGNGDLKEIDPSKLNIPKLGVDPALEESALEEEELPFGLNDIVRVSIFLDQPSTLEAGYSTQNVGTNPGAVSYRDTLWAQQNSVTANIESAIGAPLDVQWNLTLAVNAISAYVRYGDIEAIKSVPGVKSVELENRYEPQRDEVNTSITTKEMVFATNAWAAGYTGAGSMVAIIDTGTNQDHVSFNAEAFDYAISTLDKEVDLLTKDDIAAVVDQLNANNTASKHNVDVDSVYKNSKIPYALNYVDGGYVTDHYSDNQGEHGSHVSGIAAANRFVKSGDEFVDAVSASGAVGVAPDAQILTMKVFGKGGGAYDSDYMAAIEDAIILGADSANLSLGSAAPGFTFAGSYQAIMDSLVDSGTVVAISAGNSYSWDYAADSYLYADDVGFHTGGSPGTFINSLCVASAENIGVVGMPIIFNDSVTAFYTETESSGARMATIAGEYDYVYIYGIGNEDESAAVNEVVPLAGKVLITNRGEISFYVKGNNAIPYDVAAVIVANNQPGTINMALDDYTGSFPMVSITRTDGDFVIATSEESGTAGGFTYYTGKVRITDTVGGSVTTELSEAIMSDFSSWGAPGSLTMKPEITAPGGNIWSVNGMTDTDYEIMSGTSMAAPHVAGMAAVMGQYVDENGLAEKTGVNKRTLINSLLMSTAVPMQPEGSYLSILQQGAGLGNVYAASQAKSYILMDEAANTGAADGKVKVELGQDAERTGAYSYTFTINNIADKALNYALSTDMFTQGILDYTAAGYDAYLWPDTIPLDADVEYIWNSSDDPNYDVDKDGAVNTLDAQAILDVVSGKLAAEEVDTEAADFDKDGAVTSYDAYLLFDLLDSQSVDEDGDLSVLTVPAGGSKTVTVNIQLKDLEDIDAFYVNGAYVEGYTYVTCVSETEDGAYEDVQHSIPILGFYGSWTDPGMYDRTSYIGALYGTNKTPYITTHTGSNVNGLQVNYNDGAGTVWFTGNPYAVEDEFPADRLAVSSETLISSVSYNPIRNAGSAGWMALTPEGELISNGAFSSVTSAYYYVNQSTWQSTNTRNVNIGRTAGALGLQEGDSFSIGLYAIPEYYALLLDPNTKSGSITAAQAAQLLADGEIGQGSFIGHTFVVDDSEPVISSVEVSEDGKSVTVNVKDDRYLAFLGVMDVNGKKLFASVVPEQTEAGQEISYTFDLSGVDFGNAVTIIAADYAGNERAVLKAIGDGPIMLQKSAFLLTSELEDGANYLIVNTNAVGNAFALGRSGTRITPDDAAIKEANDQFTASFIDGENVDDTSVWTAAATDDDGFTFENAGTFLRYNRSLQISNTGSSWNWNGEANQLSTVSGNTTYYIRYYNNTFSANRAENSVFLFKEMVYEVEFDPYNASAVNVTPDTLYLYPGNTTALRAEVLPITLEDRSVNWTSSDEAVATVDEKGVVTAVGAGEATITAASVQTPNVIGEAAVTVAQTTPLNASVNAQLVEATGANFVKIDLNDMSTEFLGESAGIHYGGGRSEDIILGFQADGNIVETDIYDDGYDSYILGSFGTTQYNSKDGAHIPLLSAEVEGETVSEHYDSVYVAQSYLLLFDATAGSITGWNFSGNSAIAYAGTDSGAHYYYMLDGRGQFFPALISVDEEEPLAEDGSLNLSLATGEATAIADLPFDANGMSMTVLETEELYGLLIANNAKKEIYFVDLLQKELTAKLVGGFSGASGLTTLYNDDYDVTEIPIAAASIIERSMANANVMKAQKLAVLEGAAVEAPEAEVQPEEEAIVVDAEPIEEVVLDGELAEENVEVVDLDSFGDLNAFRGRIPAVRNTITDRTVSLLPASDEVQAVGSSTVTVSVAEESDVTNGLYVVSYDPASVAEITVDTKVDHVSVNVDEENSTITVAFASVDAIEAGSDIAVVTIKAGCESGTVTIETKERSKELDLAESLDIAVTGNGHRWGEPTWTWAEDYSSAVASFVCKTDETHTVELEAVITSETVDGKVVNTATVELDGKTYTDSKETEIPVDTATITGVSLSLKGQIDMNFYVIAPESAAKAVITYEKPNDDGSVNEITQEDALDHSQSYYNASTDQYKLVYPNIPAKEMTVKAVIRVFDADDNQLNLVHSKTGPVAGNAYSFCVADWANTVLAPDSTFEDVYKDMAKALLNYGDAAQKHFGFNLDNPANPNGYLAEETAAVVANPDYDAVIPANAKTELGYVGTSLNLKGATDIWMYFDHEVKATDANGKALPVVKAGNYYRVVIGNVAARKLNNMFTIRIAEGGKTYEYKYCALSYANIQMASEDATAELKTLCKAMYLYNEAAIAALGK